METSFYRSMSLDFGSSLLAPAAGKLGELLAALGRVLVNRSRGVRCSRARRFELLGHLLWRLGCQGSSSTRFTSVPSSSCTEQWSLPKPDARSPKITAASRPMSFETIPGIFRATWPARAIARCKGGFPREQSFSRTDGAFAIPSMDGQSTIFRSLPTGVSFF
jgi:hypothetical protein